MKTFSILELVKKELVGKELRICTSSEPIIKEISKVIKKSGNVTDEQFESGDPKYTRVHTYTKTVGRDQKFDNFKIIDVEVSCRDGYEPDDLVFILDIPKDNPKLQNLGRVTFYLSDELKLIETNVYSF
jgi:hypothetical protein